MAASNDMDAARRTYSGFLGLIKWAMPIIAVIVFVVLYLIS